jgi:hypothetical protein
MLLPPPRPMMRSIPAFARHGHAAIHVHGRRVLAHLIVNGDVQSRRLRGIPPRAPDARPRRCLCPSRGAPASRAELAGQFTHPLDGVLAEDDARPRLKIEILAARESSWRCGKWEACRKNVVLGRWRFKCWLHADALPTPCHHEIVHDKSAADVENRRPFDRRTRRAVSANGPRVLLIDLEPNLRRAALRRQSVHAVEQLLSQPLALLFRQQIDLVELDARHTAGSSAHE